MLCANKPYQIGGRWYIDKDARDAFYYAANVFDDLFLGGTMAVSFTATAQGVELLEIGSPQGTMGCLLPVKVSGMGPQGTDSFCVFGVTCSNGEYFVHTLYFNPVKN